MSGIEEKTTSYISDEPAVSIPSWWEEAAHSIAYDSPTDPPPITVVCGPGNSGKSTFSRILLETLLKRYKKVGYLDTDVGQPEFTAPGCLSLHIIDKPLPELTVLCLKTPERCFFYGDVNCQKDKNVYLDNILRLYDYFRDEYYQTTENSNSRTTVMPLVINTSGWVKGAGYDLLVGMLRYVSPTHVVQIRVVDAESKNLPRGMFWLDENQKGSANVTEIRAAQNFGVLIRKDARILRDLRIVAYFRQCLPRELDIPSYKELVHSLASVSAYKVPFSKLKIIHPHLQDSSGDISPSLNATVVGLGISSFVPASGENSTPWCLGLGFVRAVDISNGVLRIITPVPLHIMERVDLIIRGYVEIPSCLSQMQEMNACYAADAGDECCNETIC